MIEKVESLAALGDVHLQTKDKRDNFSYKDKDREKKVNSKVHLLQSQYERVAQVGDAFDFWQGATIAKVKKAYQVLVKTILGLDYVVGNHDKKMRLHGFPYIREYEINSM